MSTAEKPKLSQVTKGKVKEKKRSLKERFFSNLMDRDQKPLGDYIIDDIIIPALMGTIHNIITGTADKVFGGSRGPTSGSVIPKGGTTFFNYNAISNGQQAPKSSGRSDFKRLAFEDSNDAETVKDQIIALIEGPYRKASIADLYDLVGKDTEFTDNNYGWVDTKGINVTYTSSGYVLNMPNPIPLR